MATLIGAMSLTSCTKDVYNPEMDPVNRPAENPWEDIAVPAGFNWSTIASVNLKVDVEDAYGGKYDYLIEAFPANPEEDPAAIPLAAGYANLTQSYTTTLRMPQTVGNIYLRQTAPDGSQIVKTFAVQPQLDYTFAAAGSQAATKSEPGTPEFPIEVGMDHNSKNNWAYTYAFEDLWPQYGDFDFNDVVVTIDKFHTSSYRISIEGEVKATGASRRIGVGIRFLNIKASDLEGVEAELQSTNGEAASVTFEKGQTDPVLIICEDVHAWCENPKGEYPFINTETDGENNRTDCPDFRIWLNFKDKDVRDQAFDIMNMDVFAITSTPTAVAGKRTEIHVAGFAPTDLGDTSRFGEANDASGQNGPYYLSKDNYAFGICIASENKNHTHWQWPLEKVDIRTAYPDFTRWITSGGTESKDWTDHPASGKVFGILKK